MEKQKIFIAGDGFISSGDYESIKIMGSAKSSGDIKSGEVKVNGDARFNGKLEFGRFKVNGDAYIIGNIKAGNIKINGNLDIDGSCEFDTMVVNGDCEINCDIRCNNVTIRGDMKIRKNLYAKEIKIYGDSKIEGNIECEDIKVYGGINCKGLLNAENIFINPRGRSYCREIGATNIEISKTNNISFFKIKLPWDGRGTFRGEVIEGDFIKLENTEVKDLRGKDISLISKCKIENIEYTDNLEVSSDSIVQNSTKIG